MLRQSIATVNACKSKDYSCSKLSKTKKRELLFRSSLFCTPAGARTLDTLIKSQVLYQLSYGCSVFGFAGAKVSTLFDTAKLFRNFFAFFYKLR